MKLRDWNLMMDPLFCWCAHVCDIFLGNVIKYYHCCHPTNSDKELQYCQYLVVHILQIMLRDHKVMYLLCATGRKWIRGNKVLVYWFMVCTQCVKDQMKWFFSVVKVNCLSSTFNIIKPIWILRMVTKIGKLSQKASETVHPKICLQFQVMTSYQVNN